MLDFQTKIPFIKITKIKISYEIHEIIVKKKLI